VPAATVSLTEAQVREALRAFILGILPAGVEVVRSQDNRVPMPFGADFVVMTPLGRSRLSTNVTSYQDNEVVGSIAGTTLTVTAVAYGALSVGLVLIDKAETVQPGTVITGQLSGSAGGTGTYSVSPSQTVAATTLYAGSRDDLVPLEYRAQLDVYGPSAFQHATAIETLFRSDRGIERMQALGFEVTPLYSGEVRQAPFIDAEREYEDRWILEVAAQLNPIVGTWQQFAEELEVDVRLPADLIQVP